MQQPDAFPSLLATFAPESFLLRINGSSTVSGEKMWKMVLYGFRPVDDLLESNIISAVRRVVEEAA